MERCCKGCLRNHKFLEWSLFLLPCPCIQSPTSTSQLQSSTKYRSLLKGVLYSWDNTKFPMLSWLHTSAEQLFPWVSPAKGTPPGNHDVEWRQLLVGSNLDSIRLLFYKNRKNTWEPESTRVHWWFQEAKHQVETTRTGSCTSHLALSSLALTLDTLSPSWWWGQQWGLGQG